jgi:predicted MFS family arabinose efflux permease
MPESTDHRLPPTFNRLAWSNLTAQSAEQIALAAAPIVAVLLLGVGEGQTGLLQTALTLPFILFAIPAGLLADRISRRWLMAGSEALRAASLLGILLLIWFGGLTLPLLALFGFVAVCGTVAYSVAAPALVPSLVSPDLLPAANARIELARTIAFASGPALGGVLVGWVGAAPAFGFAAALSIVAVVLLSGIYEPARAPAPPRHPLQEIKEGAVFVFQHELLRPVFITQFIFNTGSFLVLAVFVPYAVRRLGLSATGVGTTLAMYGVGMVIGALLATRVMRRMQFGTVIGLGPVVGFIAAGVMALTTLTPLAMARGPELLPARRRPDPVGHQHHHIAAIGDPAAAIGAGVRDQHHELRRTADRRRARRRHRRVLRRRGVSLSGGRDLRRPGAGDPDVARGRAGAAAGDGGRRREGAAGVLSNYQQLVIACDKREVFAQRSEATKQSSLFLAMDCFAEPVIGRAFARPVGSQ